MRMSIYVNTDAKMPKKMLDALHIFETTKVMQRATHTSQAEVEEYLRAKHGDELADKFKPDFMLKTQDS